MKKNSVSFFTLLNEQCGFMTKAMKTLHKYCISPDQNLADEIISIEEQADMVRRVLIDNMNKTYFTPIDREDLFHLSQQLDEITDYAKTSVDEISLFKITPNEDMIKVVETLAEMTSRITIAVENLEKHPNISKDEAIKVKSLENVVDTMTKTAYARIFEWDNFNMIFKHQDIFRHLNHTADLADQAMDFLLDILVKM